MRQMRNTCRTWPDESAHRRKIQELALCKIIEVIVSISDVLPDPEELQTMDTVVLIAVITLALREKLKLRSDAIHEMTSLIEQEIAEMNECVFYPKKKAYTSTCAYICIYAGSVSIIQASLSAMCELAAGTKLDEQKAANNQYHYQRGNPETIRKTQE